MGGWSAGEDPGAATLRVRASATLVSTPPFPSSLPVRSDSSICSGPRIYLSRIEGVGSLPARGSKKPLPAAFRSSEETSHDVVYAPRHARRGGRDWSVDIARREPGSVEYRRPLQARCRFRRSMARRHRPVDAAGSRCARGGWRHGRDPRRGDLGIGPRRTLSGYRANRRHLGDAGAWSFRACRSGRSGAWTRLLVPLSLRRRREPDRQDPDRARARTAGAAPAVCGRCVPALDVRKLGRLPSDGRGRSRFCAAPRGLHLRGSLLECRRSQAEGARRPLRRPQDAGRLSPDALLVQDRPGDPAGARCLSVDRDLGRSRRRKRLCRQSCAGPPAHCRVPAPARRRLSGLLGAYAVAERPAPAGSSIVAWRLAIWSTSSC